MSTPTTDHPDHPAQQGVPPIVDHATWVAALEELRSRESESFARYADAGAREERSPEGHPAP